MRILARIGAALLLLPLLLLTPGTAQAHDTLLSSNPKDGATTAPIEKVTLTFNEAVLRTGAAMQVIGPNGDVAQGSPVISGPTVSQPMRPPLANGSYKVLWRVLSADGHPISGTFQFVVQGATQSPSTSTAASGSTSAAGDSLTAQPTSSVPTPPVQQVPTSSTDNNVPLIIGAAALALLLIAGGALLSRSRLKDDNADLVAEQPEASTTTSATTSTTNSATTSATSEAAPATDRAASADPTESTKTDLGRRSQDVDGDPED